MEDEERIYTLPPKINGQLLLFLSKSASFNSIYPSPLWNSLTSATPRLVLTQNELK